MKTLEIPAEYKEMMADSQVTLLPIHVNGNGVQRVTSPTANETKATPITWTDYVQAAKELGYSFRLNELDDSVEVNGRRMDDVTEAELLSRLHTKGLKSADVARRAFITDAAQNRYHPIKQYLESLEWDGNDHIAALARYFTDAHDPILYANGTQRRVIHTWLHRWIIGAVAKIYRCPKRHDNFGRCAG